MEGNSNEVECHIYVSTALCNTCINTTRSADLILPEYMRKWIKVYYITSMIWNNTLYPASVLRVKLLKELNSLDV